MNLLLALGDRHVPQRRLGPPGRRLRKLESAVRLHRRAARRDRADVPVDDVIHIAERHLPGGTKVAGRSVFYSADDLMGLIRRAETVKPIQQASGTFAFIADAGREIGTDRSGAATSTFTVIARADGTIVTMFPGLP